MEEATLSAIQPETTATRWEAVGEWLEVASGNARSAVLLAREGGLEKQALYMTEQSMEAAVKGLARWVGLPHKDVRVEGHNLLHLYAKVLDRVVRVTGTAPHVDQMLSEFSAPGEAYDALARLDQFLDLTASPRNAGEEARKFFRDMMAASPEVAGTFLTILEKTYEVIDAGVIEPVMLRDLIGKPFVLTVPPSGKHIAAYMAEQLIGQITQRRKLEYDEILMLKDLVPRIVAYHIDAMGDDQFLAELRANHGKFHVTKDQVLGGFSIPKACMGLLVIGSLVWPHQSPPRYPADPKFAHLTPQQAAQQDQLGAGHYSSDLGVIKYIRELAGHADKVAMLLNDNYNEGLFFPDWDAHPPSEVIVPTPELSVG